MSARQDVATRTVRERAELAFARQDGRLALEVCDLLGELLGAGYRLMPLAPAERPIRIVAMFSGRCRACSCTIDAEDTVWWTPGADGVDCARCGKIGA